MVAAGEVSARELVDACLERIERLNPRLNAFRVVFAERARADAGALGERNGRPLHGVPVAVKSVLARPPVAAGASLRRGGPAAFNAAGRFVPFPGPWNIVGNPALSVPAGRTAGGLPVGAQLVGRRDDEATLLSLAAQLEAERGWTAQRPPIS